MPQSLCLTIATALSAPPSAAATWKRERMTRAEQRQVAPHAEPAAVGRRFALRSNGT